MAIVMTKDGHVRPLRPSDLKEVAERDERIAALEQQCRVLAEQVDRMRPVVDAAIVWLNDSSGDSEVTNKLIDEADQYEQQMAQLAKERG